MIPNDIIRFAIGLIMVMFLVEIINRSSPVAAWSLVIILTLGFMLYNPSILYYISGSIQSFNNRVQ